MGMSIDEHIAQLKKLKSFNNGSYGTSINLAISMMRKCQMMQADYKANMVDMLTEIQAEVDKIHIPKDVKTVDGSFACCDVLAQVDEVIQERIDKLKGETE